MTLVCKSRPSDRRRLYLSDLTRLDFIESKVAIVFKLTFGCQSTKSILMDFLCTQIPEVIGKCKEKLNDLPNWYQPVYVGSRKSWH